MSLDAHVTAKYARRLTTLRTKLGAVAVAAWDRLPNYDAADIPTFVADVADSSDVAREHAALLSAAMLHHFHPSPTTVGLGDLRTFTPAEQWRTPFVMTWKALADGQPWVDAIATGRTYAENTAGQIVTDASRDAAAVIDKETPAFTRWVRDPGGVCCDWCTEMSSLDFATAEDAALNDQHDNCNCTVLPA